MPRPPTRFTLWLAPLLCATFFVALEGPFERAPIAISTAIGVGSLAWLAAVRLAGRGAAPLVVVVAGAIALRLLVLAHDPGLSDDAPRTVWEGTVVLDGTSPYAFAPDSLDVTELTELRGVEPELYEALNNRDVSAAYPPVTQAAGALVVLVARAFGRGGIDAVLFVRIFFALCDLLVLWPLVVLLRRARLPPGLAVVWGWSPLVGLEFAGSGHFDSLGILLLVAALAALPHAGRLRGGGAALVLLAGAILVKFLPLCALPFVTRRTKLWSTAWRALVVLALCALGFAPLVLMEGGLSGLTSGLSEYGLRWESTSLVYRWIEPAFAAAFERDGGGLDPRRLGRLTIAVVWAAWGLLTWRRKKSPVAATGTLIGAFLVLSPTLHPWYLTWILPFLALQPRSLARSAWLLLVAASPLFYLTLVRWRSEGVWEEPAWLWPAIAVPFLLLLAVSRITRSRIVTRA